LNIISIKALLSGIPIGFLFSFALGPVFFTIIKTSLERGFRSTIPITVGVILADLVLLALAYSGVEAFMPTGVDVSFWVDLCGGIFLLVLGIVAILNRNKVSAGRELGATTLFFQNLTKGFFLNILNPANFMEWVGAAGLLKTKYHFQVYENISFFTGALMGAAATSLAISYFAARLRKVLSVKVMQCINIGSGILFVAFGLWLLSEAFLSR
jgi:L-lysine exporter family protein LysE/ArgO